MSVPTLVRLKHVARLNVRVLAESTPEDVEFRYVDISTCGRGVLSAEPEAMTFGSAPSRARRLVRPGDTIVSTVRTYLRAVWPVTGPTDELVVSTGFAVVTPGAQLDPRYLGWLMQSDLVVDEIVARSVGVSYPAINGLEVGEIQVPILPIEVQRAIADYLDAETGRIDEIVAARRRMSDLLGERLTAKVAQILRYVPRAPLGRCLDSIEQGWSPIANEATRAGDETWGVLKLSAVTGGTFRPDQHKALEEPPGVNARYEVRRGDLLMTRANTPELVGDAAYVDGTPPRLLFPDIVYRLRFSEALADGQYLGYALRTPEVRGQLTATARGSSQSMVKLRGEDISRLLVPLPTRTEQDDLGRRINVAVNRADDQRRALLRQVELLLERRQALITAAVTGQLKIPGVAA